MCEDDTERVWSNLHYEGTFVDDVSGKCLDDEMAIEARAEELRTIKKMKV